MSLIIIPGREADYEGADWWQVRAVVRPDVFAGTNNAPLLVHAVNDAGERDQWVLKPIGRLGETNSIRELVGYRFAKALGIPVLEAGILSITEGVLRASPHLRERLGASLGPNFGSRYHPGLTDLTNPDHVQKDHRPTATNIYGWDILADNADRRTQRSNVLAGDAAMYAIDHELTFAWFSTIGGHGPRWVISMLYNAVQYHFFRDHVPRWGCGFDGLMSALEKLSGADLGAVTAGIPNRWLQGEGGRCIAEVREYLQDVHDRAEQIIATITAGRSA